MPRCRGWGARQTLFSDGAAAIDRPVANDLHACGSPRSPALLADSCSGAVIRLRGIESQARENLRIRAAAAFIRRAPGEIAGNGRVLEGGTIARTDGSTLLARHA